MSNIYINILCKLYIDINRCLRYNESILGEGAAFLSAPRKGEVMPASKAQQKAVNKYVRENYDRVLVTFSMKGKKDIIKAAADAAGESVNAYINRAVDERMEREGANGGD